MPHPCPYPCPYPPRCHPGATLAFSLCPTHRAFCVTSRRSARTPPKRRSIECARILAVQDACPRGKLCLDKATNPANPQFAVFPANAAERIGQPTCTPCACAPNRARLCANLLSLPKAWPPLPPFLSLHHASATLPRSKSPLPAPSSIRSIDPTKWYASTGCLSSMQTPSKLLQATQNTCYPALPTEH
jgi:hypothetical protein